ncbi:two-component sensor histidine kinase [Mucilaginibacter sp. PAMC 26640]|nr:two-component sensor histidine kinase [Mucilaginibacter sp. PAMC 26640]
MKIKTRLSLYFTLVSSGALLLVLICVYVAVFSFFKADFYNRITDRVNLASQLYLKADELRADSIQQLQQRYLEKLPGEVIRLYDDNNLSAFSMKHNIYWKKDIIDQVRQDGYLEYEEGDKKVVGKYFKDNQGNFVILASVIDINSSRRMLMLGQITAVLFLIFSAILFFAGQMFAQNALSPVNKIISQINQIRSTNLHLRVTQVNSKDEIAELIDNVNRLLAHLDNAFELQQTFVSNASHELRTPLTSIMGEVDVALDKPRDEQEYKRVLNSIAADGARLQETITGLMELAQVDVHYTQAKLSPVRVDELIWELSEKWTTKKGPGFLKVTMADMPEDDELLNIPANKPMLYIALNNIIDNAFKYSAGQPVTLNFTADQSSVKIVVQDKGQGIDPAEQDKIFRSFYRGSGVKAVAGSGIGLYITSKIIELFKGTISVTSDGASGSTFVLQFFREQ